MTKDTWEYWYKGKQRPIETEVTYIGDVLQNDKSCRVLDYGCGTGRHTVYLAGRGLDVYGFDLSPSAISRTRSGLEGLNLRAHLRVWDMRRPLPYRTAFFDGIICAMVMHHARFKAIIEEAGEIDRVLSPGGYLFLQVERRAQVTRYLAEHPEAHSLIEPGTYIPLKDPEKGVPHHGFTRRELEALFPHYSFLKLHYATKHYGGLCLVACKPRKPAQNQRPN